MEAYKLNKVNSLSTPAYAKSLISYEARAKEDATTLARKNPVIIRGICSDFSLKILKKRVFLINTLSIKRMIKETNARIL